MSRTLNPEAAPQQIEKKMRFRIKLGTLVVVLVSLAFMIPAPYLVLKPGPVFNTIGSYSGHQLISISGTQTYPTAGQLNMTTVSEFGGPVEGISIGQAVLALLNSSDRVVPREMFYDDNETTQQSAEQNAEDFSTSQSYAISAALQYLGKPVVSQVVVSSITANSPALGKINAGDVIESIDGVAMTSPEQVVAVIHGKPVGTTYAFGIIRNHKHLVINVTTAAKKDDPTTSENEAGTPYVGVGVDILYSAKFNIAFNLDGVGGPSAGTMFAIGIVDKLTPGALTAGKKIAGTGTIDPNGNVGPIGGIAQKLVGARRAGVVLFLAPESNCDEVIGHIPAGLTVAKMSTMSQGIQDIKDFTHGRPVPTCSAAK